MRICSPLADVPIEELNDLIVNPFQPPRWGSDDPHQGVDFAIRSPLNQIALAGNPIHAVLDGQVVAVMKERFPYGNAILIETALDTLPPDLITQLELPTPAPTLPPHPSLTCPQTGIFPILDPGHGSLYLLYAHMQEPSALVVGDSVICGDRLGTIGDSGNALNPHLHLETRVGPAGAHFPSLAHYETRAKAEEMEAYCLWRVSGVFQLVNPSLIFGQLP